MIWDCQQLITDSNPVLLPCSFTAQLLAIDVFSANQKNTWFKAGYLQSFITLDGEEFLGDKYTVGFGGAFLQIPYLNYKLQFQAQPWMENTMIRIKQLSNLEAKDILTMHVSPAENTVPQVGDPIYGNVTPVAFNDLSPVFLIAAAKSRRSILITNRTNKAMWIKEGTAASLPLLVAADPFVSLAAGASYAVEDYSGDIVGRMSAAFASGGKIIFKELPYIVN
jgi:hypothetical protein